MNQTTRKDLFTNLFPTEPAFRFKQIEKLLFTPSALSWEEASTLPASMRETLIEKVPFISLELDRLLEGKNNEAFKFAARLNTGELIETVLMKNGRGQWTVCVSSQIGCAMKCTFCATGKMGLTRNLTCDEIVDQIRLWQQFLYSRPQLPQRISNVVYMGMGEPLANYLNVRASLNSILTNTDIGPTKITVSTVGILPRLNQLLTDEEWPQVRLAISLHSADAVKRQEIVPSSYEAFLDALEEWAKDYMKLFGNRKHRLTFEYILLSGVNDTESDARKLVKLAHRIGRVHVNLIPYNATDTEFESTDMESAQAFQKILSEAEVISTIRHSLGDDIEAACGQLAGQERT